MQQSPLRLTALSAACALALQAGSAVAAAPSYTVTWLGVLNAGDAGSQALDINLAGEVVGTSGILYGLNAQARGFLWTAASGMTDLGQFSVCAPAPALTPAQACYTTDTAGNTWNDAVIPFGVNDSGKIVGTANGPGGYEHAFMYSAGSGLTPLVTLAMGRSDNAMGVNSQGDVVGHMTGSFSGNVLGEVGFFQKAGGAPQTLPGVTGADFMYAYKINDAGLIIGAGSYKLPPDPNQPGSTAYSYRPVIWELSPTTGRYGARILPGFETGILPGSTTAFSWSFAYGVNSVGQVVGSMQLPDNYHAFLYDNGVITDLGCGMAQGINTAGTVVGGETSIGGIAFLHTQGSRYDLNTLVSNLATGDSIDAATSINETGSIVGVGTHNGQSQAMVLIPDGSASAAQPAPACGAATTPPPPPAPPLPPQGADLTLTVTDAPDPVAVGATLTYTIKVVNNGNQTATAATVTDALPANLSFSSANATSGSCAGTSNLSCALGDLLPGGTATVTVVVKPTAAGAFSNSPTAAGTATELNLADNTATAVTTVKPAPAPAPTPTGGADLSVTLIDEPDPAVLGKPVVYTAKVTNKGGAAASGAMLTAQLPVGVPVTKVEGSGACTGTGTLTCNLGTIAAGKYKEMKFTVSPKTAGALSGSVQVTSSTADANPANNQATATTTVR